VFLWVNVLPTLMANLGKIVHSIPFLLLVFLLLGGSTSASIHLAPKIRVSPDDLIYEVGTTGNSLVWVFEAEESNDDPSRYSATLDGVPIEGHTLASWSDLTEIEINVDGLALGSYVVTVVVNDTGTDALQASSATDSANVHVVEDTLNPFPSTSSSTPDSSSTSTTDPQSSTSSSQSNPGETSSSTSIPAIDSNSSSTSDAEVPILLIPLLTGMLTLLIIKRRT
jgi:hypothetical protein